MTSQIVDPAIVANTALALMEHYLDSGPGPWMWVTQCEAYLEKFGSYELRDRIYEAACVIEEGRVAAYVATQARRMHLGDELMEYVGCWDYEVVPTLAELFAPRLLPTDGEPPVSKEEVRDALLAMISEAP